MKYFNIHEFYFLYSESLDIVNQAFVLRSRYLKRKSKLQIQNKNKNKKNTINRPMKF